ncbi:MAG: hypothetical protein JRI23_13460 [Deltaproteobacteria bacterium]|jgi:hypothetical protein|nr:hypothetical protein [Deltaproteobacteria bacterium]MBW2532735.1 hypothetical protein [Deltaproteobacteria bacterium]
MQNEFDAAQPTPPIQILGINNMGASSGNGPMTDGRDIPWLQDTPGDNVWGSWGVTWRDLVIVNSCNEVVQTINLTSNNLGIPSNYDAVKNALLAASAND